MNTPFNAARAREILSRVSAAALFLTPAVLLVIPGAKAWAGAILLLPAIAGWLVRTPNTGCTPSASRPVMLAMTLFAAVLLADSLRSESLSRPSEIAFRILACWLVYVHIRKNPIPPIYLWAGMAAGAAGACLLACYQYFAQGIERASGYTNALTFGQSCLVMGFCCLAGLMQYGLHARHRWFLWAGAVSGIWAALLSGGRGVWLTAFLVLLALASMRLRNKRDLKIVMTTALVLAGSVIAMQLSRTMDFVGRAETAYVEQQAYQETPYARTSTGARLMMWHFAWRLAQQKPMIGWGEEGYQQQRYQEMREGRGNEYFGAHAHNEALNMLAKHGLIGLSALLFLYIAPLYLARKQKTALAANGHADIRLALCILPLCYMGFGLTDSAIMWFEAITLYFYTLALLCAWVDNGSPEGTASSHMG